MPPEDLPESPIKAAKTPPFNLLQKIKKGAFAVMTINSTTTTEKECQEYKTIRIDIKSPDEGIGQIREIIADHFKVNGNDILNSPMRKKELIQARDMFIIFLRKYVFPKENFTKNDASYKIQQHVSLSNDSIYKKISDTSNREIPREILDKIGKIEIIC